MKLKVTVEEVLNKEIKGLEDLKQNFDFDKFGELVEKIFFLHGKVVVSGIGKSGYIAKKIAASLCSIGFPATFLHASEALHGDLGVISNHDIVMMLSNSGEGSELKQIINYCKEFKICTVGISRGISSFLIQNSDIGIFLPNSPEASELDVPTTSSIMMLAFGDVLTIALKERSQISHEQYLLYHPGGTIGLRGMKVRDVMVKDLPIVQHTTPLLEALLVASNKKLGFALVINKDNELLGIIDTSEITMQSTNEKSKTQDFISSNYKIVSGNLKISEVISSISESKYLIILEGKTPIGVLSNEILKSLC